MRINRVIPSYMGTRGVGEVQKSDTQTGLVELLIGEVREFIPPDSEKSISKQYPEYRVTAQLQLGSGPPTTLDFPNCQVANIFGGFADRCHYTLRADPDSEDRDIVGSGSKVLLLCAAGRARGAIIIGGIREDKDTYDGHSYFWEFNGAQVAVNKDGELTLTYRGATKADGQLSDDANADAEGSSLRFDKDGSIKASTKDDKQHLYVNHKDKKINVLADTAWEATVNGKLDFQVQKDILLNSSAGAATIGTAGTCSIKSAGLKVGSATESFMMGTTYRAQETVMHSTQMATLASIQAALQTAAVSLTAAAPLLVVPIVGAMAASIPIAAAAAALNVAAPLFTALSSSIATFEGSSMQYLSMKNQGD